MALKNFRFAHNSEKLSELLRFSLTGIVRNDLDRFEMPGITSNLDLLYLHRGLRFEDEVEFSFLPHGYGVKDMPIEFVVVCDVGFNPGEEDAGLYTYSEFARGLYTELVKQSEGKAIFRERALNLIQKYDLKKYADE